jgi:hypothetical protein
MRFYTREAWLLDKRKLKQWASVPQKPSPLMGEGLGGGDVPSAAAIV